MQNSQGDLYVDVTFLSTTQPITLRMQSRLINATNMERDLLAGCHIALVTTARLTKARQNLHSFPVALTASEAEDFTASVI